MPKPQTPGKKVYLEQGQQPPHNEKVYQGEKGGQYYIEGESARTPDDRNSEESIENRTLSQTSSIPEELNIMIDANDAILAPYIQKFTDNAKNIITGVPNNHVLNAKIIIVNDYIEDKVGFYDVDTDTIMISIFANKYNSEYIKKVYNNEIEISGWKAVLIHELGHRCIVTSDEADEWLDEDAPEMCVTQQASISQNERFAESYLYFLLNPEVLKARDKEAYEYVKTYFDDFEPNINLLKSIDELETVASNQKIPKYGYGTASQPETGIQNTPAMVKKNTNQPIEKEFGAVGDVSTPTYGKAMTKKDLLNRINSVMGISKNVDELKDETNKEDCETPETPLQRKVLGKIEHFEKKSLMYKSFLDGYERLALFSKQMTEDEVTKLYNISKEINQEASFNIKEPLELDRLEKVLFIDAVAHNMHNYKHADGSSLYKKLDELAGISKSRGEENRDDRLLLLNDSAYIKDKLEDLSGLEILCKSSSFDKGKSFWRLFEKSIKEGVEKLSDSELILLREWMFSQV
jgi:hypothetical protein